MRLEKSLKLFGLGVFAFACLIGVKTTANAQTIETDYGVVYDYGTSAVIQMDEYELHRDFDSAFNQAARDARDNYTYGSKICTIQIPASTYELDGRLHVYSNMTVVATGATINADDNWYGMVIVGKPESDTLNGYNTYKNITFEGGTWDIDPGSRHSASKASYFLKAAYVTNLNIKNVNVKNAYRGHMLEIGGCNGLYISGCTFTGYRGSQCYEAIQIDVMHSSSNISGYNAYTDEPVINAVIENNTFTNLLRGIGSHHTVLGKPYDNIIVRNNVFKGIDYDAVYAVSWENSQIVNNQISDAYNGIYLDKEMKHVYFPNNGSAAIVTNERLNTVISGNVISTRRTPDVSDACAGISVRGNIVYAPMATGITPGVYYYSGVTVTNNVINGGARWGIGFRYVKDCSISNNQINGKKKDTTYPRGITAKNSFDCTVSGNTIKNYAGKGAIGVAVDTSCSSVNITNTKIYTLTGKGSYGIVVRGDSQYSTVSGNLIKNVSKYGIYLKDTTRPNVSSNQIYNINKSGGYGIAVFGNTTKATLSANKIKNVQGIGIDVKKATATKILKNKIFSEKRNGN